MAPNSTCSTCEADLIDYPPNYHDGYISPQNRSVVINSYVYGVLSALRGIAEAVGEAKDAARFKDVQVKMKASIMDRMVDPNTNLFVDGVGAEHSSISAQYFPLGFGLLEGQKEEALLSQRRIKFRI